MQTPPAAPWYAAEKARESSCSFADELARRCIAEYRAKITELNDAGANLHFRQTVLAAFVITDGHVATTATGCDGDNVAYSSGSSSGEDGSPCAASTTAKSAQGRGGTTAQATSTAADAPPLLAADGAHGTKKHKGVTAPFEVLDFEAMHVVACGVGTKFCKGTPGAPTPFPDGHAEALAHRALRHFLWSELMRCATASHPLQEEERAVGRPTAVAEAGGNRDDSRTQGSRAVDGAVHGQTGAGTTVEGGSDSSQRPSQRVAPPPCTTTRGSSSHQQAPSFAPIFMRVEPVAAEAVRGSASVLFALRPGVRFHLYTSSTPCGNATIKRWGFGLAARVFPGLRANQIPIEEVRMLSVCVVCLCCLCMCFGVCVCGSALV
jgi:hypothetical protein